LHTLKVTFNATVKLINIDGLDRLYIEEGDFFGKIAIGQTLSFQDYGGSISIDYLSVHGNRHSCLMTFFRELGPVWINLDKRIEIVTYSRDFENTLSYAKSEPYTKIFMLLPTDSYRGRFTLEHEMQHYSIFSWSRVSTRGDFAYFEISANKLQSGSSWFKVTDPSAQYGIVMKTSASSPNEDTLFGPYISTDLKGESMLGKSYNVHFRLKVSSNASASDVAYIDVAYNGGFFLTSKLIKASNFTLPNSWQDFQLTFTVPSSLTYGLEFRLKNLNHDVTDLSFDCVYVTEG
jgi:hypothetical protein